jgi:hypothetical protein
LNELMNCLFAEAGVSARYARLGAVVTFVNAADEGIVHVALDVRVCPDHFLYMHGRSPRAIWGSVSLQVACQ